MKHQLCVHFKGQLVSEVELCAEQKYIMGRSEKAQIQLSKDQSLSRQHLSLQFENNVWQVNKISKLGPLIHQGHEVQQIELQQDDSFSTGAYTFYYVQKQDEVLEEAADLQEDDALQDAALQDVALQEVPHDEQAAHGELNEQGELMEALPDSEALPNNAAMENPEGEALDEDTPDNHHLEGVAEESAGPDAEGTYVSNQHQEAVLTIIMPDKNQGQSHLSLKLEGDSWLAGRQKSCPIYINSSKISRQHFKIIKKNNRFFVHDVGSSNGTKLNGIALEPCQDHPLLSGDTLRVKDIKFKFNIQQAHQHENMTHVFHPKAELTNTYQAEAPELEEAQNISSLPPAAPPSATPPKQSFFKMGVLAVVIAVAAWWWSSPPLTPRQPASKQTEKKPASTKQQIEVFYNVAHTHYVEGKYELCLEQIKKITQLKPQFEPAIQLKLHCHQALQVHQVNQQRQKQAQQQQQNKQKITSIISGCQARKHSFKSLPELRQCLAPAIELDPENPALSELEIFIENKLQTRRHQQIKNKKKQQRHNKAQAAWGRAMTQFEKGQLQKSLAAHKKIIQNYADVKEVADKSQTQAQKIQKQINSQTQTQFNQCQSAFDNQEYKQAFSFCQKALKINPRHKKSKKLIQTITTQLCKKTKTLFADANFHEYGGNITAAKQKLQSILNTGIRQCPQYGKAQRKLKKYGADEGA